MGWVAQVLFFLHNCGCPTLLLIQVWATRQSRLRGMVLLLADGGPASGGAADRLSSLGYGPDTEGGDAESGGTGAEQADIEVA